MSYSVTRMGIDGSGSVSSVNDKSPSDSGNVTLTAGDIQTSRNASVEDELGNAVKYNTPQSLTDAQKQQARDNINAPAPYEAGDNIAITGRIITTKAFPCNPNLLDNWYFGNPVNQRGQASYTGAGHTVDRWMIDLASMTVLDDRITLNGALDLHQRCEKMRMNQLLGKRVTLSVLTSDNALYWGAVTLPSARVSGGTFVDAHTHDGFALQVYIDGDVASSPDQAYRLYTASAISILAAKLELGSQQTLAHQENGKWVLNEIPKFGDQLAECQRYFRRLKFGPGGDDIIGAGYVYTDNFGRAMLALGAAMRTTPAMTHAPSARIIYDGAAYQATINSVRTATSPSLVSLELSVPAIPNQSIFMLVTGEPNAYIDLSAEL